MLPALRPAGRSAGTPRLGRRRLRSGAGALLQLGLAGSAPDSQTRPRSSPGPGAQRRRRCRQRPGAPSAGPGSERSLASSLRSLRLRAARGECEWQWQQRLLCINDSPAPPTPLLSSSQPPPPLPPPPAGERPQPGSNQVLAPPGSPGCNLLGSRAAKASLSKGLEGELQASRLGPLVFLSSLDLNRFTAPSRQTKEIYALVRVKRPEDSFILALNLLKQRSI